MDLTPELIDLLNYLLPGFIAAAVHLNLTPFPRPTPFERIVQALILTIVVQVVVFGLHGAANVATDRPFAFNSWSENVHLAASVVVAIGLGLILARLSNRDALHSSLRNLGITHQTSFPSEWYGALSQNRGYVVLHLVGERRLYGWPEEWPSSSDAGHFVIAQAEWLLDAERIPLKGVDKIVIPVSDVEMLELMHDTTAVLREEDQNGRT